MSDEIKARRKALAKFKGVKLNEVKFEGSDPDYPEPSDEYSVDGETYIVVTEDEADQLLRDDVENFIDDVGLSGFTPWFFDWIKDNALDMDWFEDACRESEESYAYDIAYEDGRLEEECVDAGIISSDDLDEDGKYTGDLDLSEEYAEYLFNRVDSEYAGDFVQWYVDNFGDLSRDTLKYVSYDLDTIVDEIKSQDGYGSNLARYDGTENEENGYYIFRQG